MKSVIIDGIKCWWRSYSYLNYFIRDPEYHYTNVDNCSVCGKELEDHEDVYLFMNNSKMFPNCLIHVGCAKEDMKITVMELKLKYEAAQGHLKIAREIWPDYKLKEFY